MNDSLKHDYPIKIIRQVLNDIRNNPGKHNHPKELVEECLKLDNTLKAEIMEDSVLGMSQNIAFIREYFLHNDPFKELLKQNPIFQLAKQFQRISETLPSLYGEVYGNFTQFSEMGWYLSNRVFDEIATSELARVFREEDRTELEELIVSEAEKMIPEMLENCRNDFPHRAQIFNEIENAFNSGNYYSVVVLAYTQADGICNDIFGNGFFDTEKIEIQVEANEDGDEVSSIKPTFTYRLKTWGKVEQMEWNHSISVIEQLEIRDNEISAFSNGKSGKFTNPEFRKSSFNRHLVLHGHSFEYGTKENAIRAICILDFLHLIITEAVEIDQ